MTRWKAIGLLVVSLALLATACGGDGDEEKPLSDEFVAFIEESQAGATDDGQADEDAVADEEETAPPPGDDDGEDVTSDSTTPTLRTDGGDPPNDQTDSSGNVYPEGEGNPGGDIVSVRHEPGPEGQQYFVIDVVGDGEETSKGPHIYSVSISWLTPDGEEGLATVKYDNGPPVAKLRSSDQGRPEIEGTLVTAEWEDSDTLRVCVDGGETKVEVESFRVQINVVPGPGSPSWVDSALGLAG